VESARNLIISQAEAEKLDRSAYESSIIRFHERRQFLLECLRLILRQSLDVDGDETIRQTFMEMVALVLQTKDGPVRNGPLFMQRCLSAMTDIERWLQDLAERIQSASVLEQAPVSEIGEIMGFQRMSLKQQHESLGAITCHLVKAGRTSTAEFHILLEKLKRMEKLDLILLHYIPCLISSFWQYGSPEGSVSLAEARSIHNKIEAGKDSDPWMLRSFQAAAIAWWLAEYSGWYVDAPVGSPLQDVDLDAEAAARSNLFFDALKDGAFQFTLSIAADSKPNEWYDPARQGLTQFLLFDAPALPSEPILVSDYFATSLMEQLESFVDTFISNMPDTLRRLKAEQDDQRKRLRSGLQSSVHNAVSEHELHLERFLVIISYAFESRPEAAQAFWADPDGNLYGFLQWSSKRQSTPRVSAFCEMLRAISEGEEYAGSAHKFLLEEGQPVTSRIRRSSSLSWAQIFAELQFYASKIRDRPANPSPGVPVVGKPMADEIDEPESAMMLECYLRLTAHLCCQSSSTRSWILTHPTFRLVDVLFLLCSSAIPSRLRACGFTTLTALLTQKNMETGELVWTSLDQWISGGYSPSSLLPKPAIVPNAPAWAEDAIFETIATGFEEPNTFVGLLRALMSPSSEDIGLNDSLPYPEMLGSAYRMPGVEPYIDFALGRIFGVKTLEIQDPVQLRLLRWNCLDFVVLCLSTFNEDLVLFANKSTISVDQAMTTSSLATYVRLHPFSRVMDWMFNERTIAALFACTHQDVDEISSAPPDSPLVLAVVRGIEVLTLVMSLQATYLDIVRPILKAQPSARRPPVSSPSLASLEDSILNNLHLIVDLGLYCGIGHQELSMVSLKLLEKISSSRRLISPTTSSHGQWSNGNKIIGILEKDNESDRIARSLALEMQVDVRELDQGPDSPGYNIKSAILDFLSSCLRAFPTYPTIAHSLLGFVCDGGTIDIDSNGLFAKGISLFHAIMRMVMDYPDIQGAMVPAWLMRIRQKGFRILETLWTSPLSATYTMTELRANDFLSVIFRRQFVVESSTMWDGRANSDPDFLMADSAICYEDFLDQRTTLFGYAATELRMVALEGAPSIKSRVLATLLGETSTSDRTQIPNPTIFDLFDFAELGIGGGLEFPASKYFAEMNFRICKTESPDGCSNYDLQSIEQLLALQQKALKKAGRLQGTNDDQEIHTEALRLMLYFHASNQCQQLLRARRHAIRSWVELMMVVLEYSNFDSGVRTALVLQALQVILPKLERYAVDNVSEASELARLSKALLFQLDFTPTSALASRRAGDVANDRLFQLFRTSLRGIQSAVATTNLRETFYNICYRYLIGMAEISNGNPVLRRHSTQTVKSAGEKLVEVICDDALTGEGTCRISALLLLDALVSLAKQEDSRHMIDSFVRINFIGILVDTIRDIPVELRETNARGKLHIWLCEFVLVVLTCTRRTVTPVLLQREIITRVTDFSN